MTGIYLFKTSFFFLSNAFCARAVSQQPVKLRETSCVYGTEGPGRKAEEGQQREKSRARGGRAERASEGESKAEEPPKGKGAEDTSVYTRAREADHKYYQ